MNKIKLTNRDITRNINVPISMNWDFLEREDTLIKYEEEILNKILGFPNDYEVKRFEMFQNPNNNITLPLTYNFNFKSTTENDWVLNYSDSGRFTEREIYNNVKKYDKSFFKLDFYDTTNTQIRKNYLTIILNKRPNKTTYTFPNQTTPFEIDIPSFTLNYNKNQEGFFIYWFEDPTILNIDTLYMTAKFFDASNGQFTSFTTKKQTTSTTPYRLGTDYFNRRVSFNYDDSTYKITLMNQSTVQETVIEWYEYINPTI